MTTSVVLKERAEVNVISSDPPYGVLGSLLGSIIISRGIIVVIIDDDLKVSLIV